MTVDGRSSTESMEDVIRRVPGVRHAAVVLDSAGKILEIHVSSSSDKPVKMMVRDVQTAVLTHFPHRSFSHRMISVVPMRGETEGPASRDGHAAAQATHVTAAEAAPETQRAADRIRFVSVNLYVSGPRAQAQVELRWKGITRMGSASGTATRDGAHQLVAAATVSALEEFLEEDWSLGVHGIQFLQLGKTETVVVGLTLLAHRREKTLAGCCTVEQDVPQAVALATLAALNRVVGGLETREPIEYVLRPASFQEASEAKNP